MDRNKVVIDVAYGSAETGCFAKTPMRPLRKWPYWTLRAHMPEGTLMARRFDYGDEANKLIPGSPYANAVGEEYRKFIQDTHVEIVPKVWVLKVVKRGVTFYPDVISFSRFEGRVSRWLDSLPTDEPIVFPEVVNPQFCEMLHRRGFLLLAMWDDDAADDDWVPVHVRGSDKAKGEDF